MQFLRQNTDVIVTVGPFYDKTDGVTLKTALTITNERITLTADTDNNSAPTNVLDNVTGATSGTSNDLNYITGNDAAMMQMELSAANTNRVGRMMLSITDSANHVPVFQEFFVLPQAIYDWLTGVIVPLPANLTQIEGSSAAADGLLQSTKAIGTGVVGSSSSTTSIVTSSINPTCTVADQFKGKIISFAKDTTTANLRSQSTDITANTSGGVLTVTALTTAPVSGDTFSIT